MLPTYCQEITVNNLLAFICQTEENLFDVTFEDGYEVKSIDFFLK